MEMRMCPECGGSLPIGTPEVFCPACALRGALAGSKPPGERTMLDRLRRLTARKDGNNRLATDPEVSGHSPAMTTVAPAPGEVIGDYKIVERLGGNMGLVFKARHLLLNKEVALKLLPSDRMADPARLARFQREMRVMAQLEHPNLVTAQDARSVGDWHFVAMALIDGVDLQEFVRAHGPLAMANACEIARQAALGLQYAHQNGLIHRDVKPSNLMLTRSGTIKLIDMGLALAPDDSAGHLTHTGLVLGTMSYCAPEQFRDSAHVDIRADIYSLGCTLFLLLTGKTPYWQRKTLAEVVESHLHEPFPALTDFLPNAPAPLAAVLKRMTAKDREARFNTPAEVAEALAPFTSGTDLRRLAPEKIQGAPPSPRPTGTPPAVVPLETPRVQPKARPARFAAALLILLAVAIGGIAYLAMNQRPRNAGAPRHDLGTSPTPTMVTPPAFDGAGSIYNAVLIDSSAARAVYDEEVKDTGDTNAEMLKRVLDPLKNVWTSQITISGAASKPEWRGENEVIRAQPHILFIHRSAFFHAVYAAMGFTNYPPFLGTSLERTRQSNVWQVVYGMSDDKLVAFMGYLAKAIPGLKIVVYSRGTDVRWKENEFRARWRTNCEDRFPELKNNVETVLIPSERPTFKDPLTAEEFRTLTRKLLHKIELDRKATLSPTNGPPSIAPTNGQEQPGPN